MKNRWLMGLQRLSMEGKLVYRTSLRKRGWENFIQEEENWGIHIALGEDGTAGRFWNRNVRTVSSEKWRHTYCVSAIKCASLSLSEKSLVVFLSRVENHKRNVSDTVVFPFRHFTFTCKEASKEVFLKGRLCLLCPELQGAASGACPTGAAGQGPRCRGPILRERGGGAGPARGVRVRHSPAFARHVPSAEGRPRSSQQVSQQLRV